MNTSRPSIIGASSDTTRDSKPPSGTPLGYSYEAAKNSEASCPRGPEPPSPQRHCSYLYSGTKSLVHSRWVCPTHLQFAHMVHAHALYGSPHRTAVKTYVPTLRCVRSRHLCRLLCVKLILPLPQLVRCSRTPCRRAKVLLTRPRPHIPIRGLLEVSTRRGCRWTPRRCAGRTTLARGGSIMARSHLRV